MIASRVSHFYRSITLDEYAHFTCGTKAINIRGRYVSNTTRPLPRTPMERTACVRLGFELAMNGTRLAQQPSLFPPEPREDARTREPALWVSTGESLDAGDGPDRLECLGVTLRRPCHCPSDFFIALARRCGGRLYASGGEMRWRGDGTGSRLGLGIGGCGASEAVRALYER